MFNDTPTPTSVWCTPYHAEEGVDVENAIINIAEEKFPRSYHVTSMGTIQTTFLLDEELVPIKIKKIPGNSS